MSFRRSQNSLATQIILNYAVDKVIRNREGVI